MKDRGSAKRSSMQQAQFGCNAPYLTEVGGHQFQLVLRDSQDEFNCLKIKQ